MFSDTILQKAVSTKIDLGMHSPVTLYHSYLCIRNNKHDVFNRLRERVSILINWNQLCNLFILVKQHSMKKEWMNFLLWQNRCKSKNCEMLKLSLMMSQKTIPHRLIKIHQLSDQCDYQATTKGNLTVHIQSKHEGFRFGCDRCDYQATKQSNLTRHIESKHEGVELR